MGSDAVFRRMVRIALVSAALGLLWVGGSTTHASQATPPAAASGSELDVIQVRPDFYMLAGAGANVAVQIGPDGTVVVDTGAAARADEIIAAIKKLTGQPIRYIINTGAGADHVGGNAKVAQAGRTIFVVGNALATAMTNNGGASILANENVLRRMSAPTGEVSPYPSAAWPTETFETGRKYMYMNREGIEVLHQPGAHSDADSFVVFRRSDVVVAGDVLDTRRFPTIDLVRGGSVQGEIAALNRLVALAIPSIPLVWQEGGTYVIPGHGRLSDQTDVVEYRDMVTIVRDRVQAMARTGMTLVQVQAAKPAQGYTSRYGSESSAVAATFVEAVYVSLTTKR